MHFGSSYGQIGFSTIYWWTQPLVLWHFWKISFEQPEFDDVVRWLCRGYGGEDIGYVDKEGFEDNLNDV